MTASIEELMPSIRKYRTRASKMLSDRRKSKTLQQWTYQTETDAFSPEIMNTTNTNKIFIGVSDVNDMLIAEALQRRTDSRKNTLFRNIQVSTNRRAWTTWCEKHFAAYLYMQANSSHGFIINQDTDDFITYRVDSNSTEVSVYGDSVFVERILKLVSDNFDEVVSHIEWVYATNGSSATIPLNKSRLPVKEMYPFLKNESLEDFYDRFMNSNSNILLLIGPPGTGKTTFIRGLLSHTNSSAHVTYDPSILEKDHIFAEFIGSDSSIMVLEDSDNFLKPRSDGNTMMSKFLNLGDGLVTTKGKKLIFSTNLPSIRDVDEALTRPGRCFGILNFNGLTYDEAKVLHEKLKLTNELHTKVAGESSNYTLAEIFNNEQIVEKETHITRKVGFV
jgi:ATP-dependent 26S proteasome regulatory subunit